MSNLSNLHVVMNFHLIPTFTILFFSLSGTFCEYDIIGSHADTMRTGHVSFRSRREVSISSSTNFSISSNVSGLNDTTKLPTTPVVTTTLSTSTTTNTTTSTTPAPVVDQHTYYTTQLFDDFDRFWIELYFGSLLSNAPTNISNSAIIAVSHDKLSMSYRTAAVVDLKFTFPFYGHPVKRVVIATGGFIYVGEVLNPRLLTFSQFIAPLMANFDFSVGDFTSKRLLYFSNESMLIVEWRDVVLQERPSLPFRFQAHIYRDGRIVFAYRDMPLSVNSISQNKHPVEISLSDAYSSERKDSVTGASFQTMHVYSETRVPNEWVKSRSAVVFTPLPTCIQLTSCSSCLTPAPTLAFKCAWCPTLRRCSFGFDRGRKTWMDSRCDIQNVTVRSDCSLLPWSQRDGESLLSPILSQSYQDRSSGSGNGSSSTIGAWAVLIILIILAILAAIGLCIGWVVYAHKHPGSRAGIWLVEHRPARVLQDTNEFFRRTFASARDLFSSRKPSSSSPSSDNWNGGNRHQPVVSYNGPNGQQQNPFDVSIGGVTVSASRI